MGPEPAVAGGAGAWRSALFAPDKQQFLARYRPVDSDAAARRGEGAVLRRVRRELMHEKRDIGDGGALDGDVGSVGDDVRSEEHTAELQSLMRTSYAVFFLQIKNY